MAGRDVDLGWLRLFEALGRLGNMTRVAEQFGMSQPAVSYQIRRLEEELGATLVSRLHRGAALTREGQMLHEAVKHAVGGIDGVVRQIRRQGRSPVISIHTDFGFASYWLMPRLSAFRQRSPDIEVHVLASQTFETVAQPDADLRIVFGERGSLPAGALQLIPEEVVPVCSPGYLAKHGPIDDLGMLAEQALIHLEGDSGSRWYSWQSWLREQGVARLPGPGDVNFNTYNLVIQAAMAEQGVALGWMGLVDSFLDSGILVTAGPKLAKPGRGYWLVANAPEDSITARVTSWLLEENARHGLSG